MFTQFTMLGFMALVFWLLIIRPQQKKAKEQGNLLKQLKKNDKIVTSAGLVGIVLNVRDDSITLRTGDSTVEIVEAGRLLENLNLLSATVTRTRKREVQEWRVIRTATVLNLQYEPHEMAFYDGVTAAVRNQAKLAGDQGFEAFGVGTR